MVKRRMIIILLVSSLLVFGLILNLIADKYIITHYPNPPILKDFLLDRLPYKDLSHINEFFLIITYIVFVIFIVKTKSYNELPSYLFIMALFSIFRSLFIVMTPLGSPHPGNSFGLFPLPNHGMFPSGHISVPLMFLIFSYYKKEGIYVWIFFILFIAIISTMIISRGHYTIDMIATVFIVYSIYSFTKKHLMGWLEC